MENKVALSSLVPKMVQASGKSKKLCEDFLREFFRLISDTLQEDQIVKIKGFGTFKISEVESRTSVNVNTGQPFEIQRHKKVVFTPAKELASLINSPFEEFESVEMDDEIPEEIFLEEEAGNKTQETPERQEKLSDENKVSEERLVQGSDEEGEDDEITYEAYKEIEKEKEEELESLDHLKGSGDPEVSTETAEEVKPQDSEERPEEKRESDILLPVYVETPKKSRFGIGFLTGSLSALVICVVIFMLGCFFDWWPVNFGSPKEAIVENSIPDPQSEQSEQEDQIVESIPEEPVYDTVSTTRYLTTIARDHYGNFNFWPYIYFENESILGHPDRITPGTKVIVPDLKKYGVDPSNKEDVAEAKRKGAEIYSRFKNI